MSELVWVQLDEGDRPIRIFRNDKAAQDFPYSDLVCQMERRFAVLQIRRMLFDKQHGECLRCGGILTWASAHMHEKIHRGEGGEISMENSELLCAECHLKGEHGDRQPRFGE